MEAALIKVREDTLTNPIQNESRTVNGGGDYENTTAYLFVWKCFYICFPVTIYILRTIEMQILITAHEYASAYRLLTHTLSLL